MLENYRWENSEPEEIIDRLQSASSTCNAWLWRIESDLGTVSEEQYLLLQCRFHYLRQLHRTGGPAGRSGGRRSGHEKPPQLYYNKIVPCGGYLRQYTQQLLNTAITDAQGTYTTVSALSDRVKWVQTVVVALCLALGCVMAFSVLTLLTPVQQMIGASREVTRGEFDSPDLPAPRQPEMAQLTEAFNHMKHSMAEQVTTLREKNEMERELHRQKTEALELQNRMERSRLQQLRSQIDPHFPFQHPRTSFYRPPDRKKLTATQALITALSHLLRYSLMSNDEQVPLSREVRSWMNITRSTMSDLATASGWNGASRIRWTWRRPCTLVYFAAHCGKRVQARHLPQGGGRRGPYPGQSFAGERAALHQRV